MVKELIDILSNDKELLSEFEKYLIEKILNEWTSLLKISQYAEHSSNYLENFWGDITNRKLAKMSKFIPFINKINKSIVLKLGSHNNPNYKTDKMKKP